MSTVTATDAIWFIDNLARIRVAGSDSGGRLAVVEAEGRRGDMPPLHVTGVRRRRSTSSRASSRCICPAAR